LRLDINVGDPVHTRQITYPTVLSDEPFTLLGYPVETVVTEKVDTMITRGDANTRERDYADVLMLSRTHALEARALRKALEETAAYRGTELLLLSQTRWTPCQRSGKQAGGPSSSGPVLPTCCQRASNRQCGKYPSSWTPSCVAILGSTDGTHPHVPGPDPPLVRRRTVTFLDRILTTYPLRSKGSRTGQPSYTRCGNRLSKGLCGDSWRTRGTYQT
jgi:hypothetical protein